MARVLIADPHAVARGRPRRAARRRRRRRRGAGRQPRGAPPHRRAPGELVGGPPPPWVARAELVRQAHRDGLTGLPNERSFEARLAEEAEQVRWVRHHHERWDGAG
jgi:GGDEF domain-containing protein